MILRVYVKDFYSHIPCGMWQRKLSIEKWTQKHFYSHIPCGMWRCLTFHTGCGSTFLLTHPVWDVTVHPHIFSPVFSISTHTSRVGCDVKPLFLMLYTSLISTHTSRVGCDSSTRMTFATVSYFYSHIPCGMWHGFLLHSTDCSNFYSHIPCGMWR